MAKKKNKPVVSATQEDVARSREVLGHYHQIISKLRKSASRKQAEEALYEINGLSEGAQVSLAKALAKEQHTDAADLLAAMNELGSQKSARKEAKRSLIQLEALRIYPNWRPPIEESAMPVPLALRRFWKGQYTDSLDIGEVNLMLCWEQGTGYKRLLVLGFLLDFTTQGVKDFFTFEERKEDYDNIIAQMARDLPVKTCTLAEGRSLLRRSLAINEQYGVKLPADYRRQQSLISQLVLDVPGLEGEDVVFPDFFDEEEDEDEDEPDLSGLDPQTVVTTFVENWARDDFDIAYRLLASDSPLREGLTEEEWAELRFDWAEEFDPGDFQPDFAEERETQKSRLWLPRGGDRNVKVIEAGWSIELDEGLYEDVSEDEEEESPVEFDEGIDEAGEEQDELEDEEPGDIILPELPAASAIYQETGRHWYLASYTLVKDQGEWRIQNITDEATLLRQLSAGEIQARIAALNRDLNTYVQKHPVSQRGRVSENKAAGILSGMITRMLRLSYVLDAAIAQDVEVDRSIIQSIASTMSLLEMYERSIYFFEYLAKQSAEVRVANLRGMAAMRRMLANQFEEKGYDERAERFRDLAAQELEELIAREEDGLLHISLADVLLDRDRRDEAEDHLLRAKAMTTDDADLAHIEMHLGEIALDRGSPEEALAHFQQVTSLQPDAAESWADLAKAYAEMGDLQEAEAHFRHAIELEPDNVNLYQEMSAVYDKVGDTKQATAILEEGLQVNPDSLDLNIVLATTYLAHDDMPGFERTLNTIARLDPRFPGLSMLRSALPMLKSNPDRSRRGDRPKINMLPPVLPPLLGPPAKKKKRH